MTTSRETIPATSGAASAFDVLPTGAALGAVAVGLDLRDIDDAAFGRLLEAWHTHSVVLVRGQALSDQDLIAFSRRLGDLDWAPIQENGRRFVEGLPEIYIVSNVKVNGKSIGSLGDGEAVWHTDMSYLDMPPKASMLYALEVPVSGEYVVLQHVRHLQRAARRTEEPHRRPQDQARWHLQQRRLCTPRCHVN